MEKQNKYEFTTTEWENCLKVLMALKDTPFDNPDNEKFGALITKIHKNAKKSNRNDSYNQKRQSDIETNLSATLAQYAINGQSMFWDETLIDNHKFTKLNLPKNCYCCNQMYELAHSFYTRLCPTCATENYEKRFQNIDLKGRNVILTGGRVKVGFATALRLLRNGANVVLTTRFPALALEQLQNEKDYDQWKDRLIIYGLDLRSLSAISEFIQFYKSKFNCLDILINNAAQTIKYPDVYYLPLLKQEEKLVKLFASNPRLIVNKTLISYEIKYLEYNKNESTEIELNRFGQPVDNRDKTSWNSTLEEITMHELIEVNLI